MPEADGFQVMDGLSRLNWPKGLSVLVCTSKDLSVEEKHFFDSRIRAILKSAVNTG